jgi:hypothetical protein
MIKLDPDEEAGSDDEDKPKSQSQKQVIMPSTPNQVGNSSYPPTDAAVNNVHTNNVQINLTRINLPPEYQNFVSLILNFIL